MVRILFLGYLLVFLLNYSKCQESFCVLNGKKSLNYVSDKFISFTVDPTVLCTNLNLSETAHELGRYLTPAYVRISGPSTKYLKFSPNEEHYLSDITNNPDYLIFTSSFVDRLNEWFINTNLSMIFALNDAYKINDKSADTILEITAKINPDCLWEFGRGINTSYKEYIEHLKLLKHAVEKYSPKGKTEGWGIASSELNDLMEIGFDIRKSLVELQGISKATFWHTFFNDEKSPTKDEMNKLLSSSLKPTFPVWTTIPKAEKSVTFSSTLNLAQEIGELAILGYNAVFVQPRFYELTTDTSDFWYILYHKNFMGRNVLDVKATGVQKSDVKIYAHCAKNQNQFSRRGAITISIINSGLSDHTASIKLPINTINVKHIEVQSYILTSGIENATVYCNGKILNIENLRQNRIFTPKVRRARISNFLTLTIPSKSIGFFILPDARISICINDEDETNLIIEDIEEVINDDVSNEIRTVQSRNSYSNFTSLREMYHQMQNELEIDEKFYNQQKKDVKVNDLEDKTVNVELEKNKGILGKIKQHIEMLKEPQLEDNFDDVTSQEIEEVVLKVTKTFKEKNYSNKKDTKNVSKRDINMDLLEKKVPNHESLNSKIKNLFEKSVSKTYERNPKNGPAKIGDKVQEMLFNLLNHDPLDVSRFINLRSAKETEKNEETKPEALNDSMQYLDGVQDDYLDDLDMLGAFQNIPENDSEKADVKERSKNILKSLLNNKKIGNNENDEVIKKTLTDLENIFNIPEEEESSNLMSHLNDASILDNADYPDYDEELSKFRKKRNDEKRFTEEDIMHYRQLMNSNIRHMRDNILKNKFKLKTTKKEQTNISERINRLKEAVEIVQKSNDKEVPVSPFEPIVKSSAKKQNFNLDKFKLPVNNNNNYLKLNSVKLLKSRLAQHKLNQNGNDNNNKFDHLNKEKDEIDDETKQLIKMIKLELRNRKQRDLKWYEKEYTPNVNDEEIVRKSYVPKFKSQKNNRLKRHIEGNKYKKYGNSINSINDIVKDVEYFVPKLASDSDFTLFLPKKDKIFLKNNENSSEIKLEHVTSKTKDSFKDESITDASILKYLSDNTTGKIYVTKKENQLNETKLQQNSNKKVPDDDQGPFDKLLKGIAEFIISFREKIKTYLKLIDD